MVDDHLKAWNGIPIKNYNVSEPVEPETIYRLRRDWDMEGVSSLNELFEKFLADPNSKEVVGLSWGGNGDDTSDYYGDYLTNFLEKAAHFPKLRFLFLGEMTQEEAELTWIVMADVGAPFFNVFPCLEELRIRGGEIEFSSGRHICLKTLALESGGLDKNVLKGIRGSVLPELERLEIWLGCEDAGGDCTIEDIQPLILENPFPKLKFLAIKNSEIADEVAQLIATAPILSQLEELDLSLGTLRDEGALALLESEGVKNLKKLNLSHHYMSDEVMARFSELGINVDVSDQEEADSWDDETHYYVAVSE